MLKVEGVHTYYGRSHILQGISLEVGEGEVVCLLGRNGAGKTTTLRTIIGLTPPKIGEIKFRGNNIAGMPPYEISRIGMGYVPQDRRIFPELTVEDNLEVVRAPKEAYWGKREIYELFPELGRMKSSRGKNLSGGEQQMLAIARALMLSPKMLLLDEPSEGLAPIVVNRIGGMIEEVTKTKKISILMSEQNISFSAQLGHRGYIIDKGQIFHEAPMDELKDDREVIGKYLAV